MPKRGLPKKYAKMGFKKGWAAYKRTKKSRKTTPARKTTRRRVMRTARRKRKSYRRSNKWGTVGTVLKLAVGAYVGNVAGGYIAKYADPTGSNVLYRAAGSLIGAIAAKKLLGKMNPTIATGAAAVLAGGAAADFMLYMQSRNR